VALPCTTCCLSNSNFPCQPDHNMGTHHSNTSAVAEHCGCTHDVKAYSRRHGCFSRAFHKVDLLLLLPFPPPPPAHAACDMPCLVAFIGRALCLYSDSVWLSTCGCYVSHIQTHAQTHTPSFTRTHHPQVIRSTYELEVTAKTGCCLSEATLKQPIFINDPQPHIAPPAVVPPPGWMPQVGRWPFPHQKTVFLVRLQIGLHLSLLAASI